MGTAKRERQKANREKRRAEDARVERKRNLRTTILTWGGGILAAFIAVLAIAYFTGAIGGSDDEASTETTVATSDSTGDGATMTETTCPNMDGSSERVTSFAEPPPMCIDPSKTYTAEIVTTKGSVTAELYPDKAPVTVNNFVVLSMYHYYDGLSCHRIIPGFMAQCGDPTGDGSGGPGYTIEDEFPEAGSYQVGSLAMAKTPEPNSGGSQFFMITGMQGVSLPPEYSLFGQITDGLDTTLQALDAAGNTENNGVPPLEPVSIESITITES